jgi:hypothetical protein
MDIARTFVNVGLAVSSAVVVQRSTIAPIDIRDEMVGTGLFAASGLLWPIMFDWLIGYQELIENPKIAFGFMLPLILTVQNLQGSDIENFDRQADSRQSEAQALISAVFSIGILNLDQSLREEGIGYIMLAILLCVAVVIPRGLMRPRNPQQKYFVQAYQRAGLNYAVGFLLIGLLYPRNTLRIASRHGTLFTGLSLPPPQPQTT